jgi:hypothetical protein
MAAPAGGAFVVYDLVRFIVPENISFSNGTASAYVHIMARLLSTSIEQRPGPQPLQSQIWKLTDRPLVRQQCCKQLQVWPIAT